MPISKITSAAIDGSATTDALTLPIGTTAQRPASSVNGFTRYNSVTNTFETYANSGWQPFDQYAYTNIQAFTSSGSFTVPAGVTKLQVLVVAGGGGGGGYYYAGGGGAGGLIFERNYKVTPAQIITATVGSGGASQSSNGVSGNRGNNSVFGTLTAIGGGYGAAGNHHYGGPGGSGGGCGSSGIGIGVGGACTNGQGSNGGGASNGTSVSTGGGGGGGAGKHGADTISSTNTPQYGHGGDGLYIPLFSAYGASGYFAGGGGGAHNANTITTGTALGGLGGGGNSGVWNDGNSSPAPVNGSANTGGGGGGAMHIGNNTGTGAAGGSGVILIAWYQ